jgi:hypothetical protein
MERRAMAIQVNSIDPQGLLDSIYEAIDAGNVETWAYDDEGDFFHETADGQWVGKAWLHPAVETSALILNVIPPDNGISTEAYAVYHAGFEMLLPHFDDDFSEAFATVQPATGDRVG